MDEKSIHHQSFSPNFNGNPIHNVVVGIEKPETFQSPSGTVHIGNLTPLAFSSAGLFGATKIEQQDDGFFDPNNVKNAELSDQIGMKLEPESEEGPGLVRNQIGPRSDSALEVPQVFEQDGNSSNMSPSLSDFNQALFERIQTQQSAIGALVAASLVPQASISCTFCQKKFPSTLELTNHTINTHFDQPLPGAPDILAPSSESAISAEKKAADGAKNEERSSKYECKFCNKRFNWCSNLRVHERTHTGERPHMCNYCHKRFIRKTDLIEHKRTHTGERPHKCSYCEKAFVQRTQMVIHERRHTGEKPYHCDLCQNRFASKTDLIRHTENNCGLVKPHVCEMCGQSFGTPGNLEVHIRNHTGDKPYECEICFKKFARKNNMVAHKRVHLGLGKTKNGNFQCLECPSKFSREDLLHRHIKRNHTENEGVNRSEDDKPTCFVCGKTFCEKSALTRHLLVHTGEKSIDCPFCDKQFSQNGSLKKHLLVHSGEKPHKCAVCDKRFAEKGKLKIHMNTVHEYRKDYICEICGKGFGTSGNLKDHGRRVHSDRWKNKTYKCRFCTEVFSEKNLCDTHELASHPTEFRHVCVECGKSFVKDTELKRHARIHSGERPFKCSYCDMCFAQASGCSNHETAMHTKAYKHVCEECGKGFLAPVDLRRHLKSKHGKAVSETPIKAQKIQSIGNFELNNESSNSSGIDLNDFGQMGGTAESIISHVIDSFGHAGESSGSSLPFEMRNGFVTVPQELLCDQAIKLEHDDPV